MFTPAPWNHHHPLYYADDAEMITANDGDEIIASYITPANAHLIAAAPELLGALEVALVYVEFMASAIDADPEDHERLALIQNAIAKAEGKI